MRSELKKIGGQERHIFTAIPIRLGTKTNTYTGNEEDTILLKDIQKENKTVSHHLWFNYGIGFSDALENMVNEDGSFKPCKIEFSGRVTTYEKGWRGRKAEEEGEARYENDYKIERPTKIKIIQEEKRLKV